ncbi:MAG TPA: hypothetical protein VMK65_07130, partial [Longimicrobiales bacterium]|nr:hypothetical protein [Longimicrobiales bacterium]
GVVLAHLSDRCNAPALARSVVGRALERLGYRGRLEVAPQAHPLEPLDVPALRRASDPEQLSLL